MEKEFIILESDVVLDVSSKEMGSKINCMKVGHEMGVTIIPELEVITLKIPSEIMEHQKKEIMKIIRKIVSIAKKNENNYPEITFSEIKNEKYKSKIDNETYVIPFKTLIINSEKVFKTSENWSLMAMVDNYKSGFVRFSDEMIPRKYLKPIGKCDYCNVKKYRNKVFIIKSNGVLKSVGNECIKKYIDFDVTQMISYFTEIRDLKLKMEREDFWREKLNINSSIRFVDGDKLISAAYKVIKEDNKYVKKKYYDGVRANQGESTSDKIEDILPDIEIDNDFVSKFKNHISNIEPKNEFETKLKKLVKGDLYRLMDVGMVGYAVYSILEKEKQKDKTNNFLGIVGEKYPFTWLKIIDIKCGVGTYGYWQLYFMEDKYGNSVIKFGEINEKYIIEKNTQEKSDYVEIGDVVAFNGMVKSHDDKGLRKETQVSNITKL